jgi:ankyrin repeat protein
MTCLSRPHGEECPQGARQNPSGNAVVRLPSPCKAQRRGGEGSGVGGNSPATCPPPRLPPIKSGVADPPHHALRARGEGKKLRLPNFRSVSQDLRSAIPIASLLLAMLMASFAAAPASAQNAPSREELAIYAGLHEAAAKGDAAAIEKLIKEGEKPNIQDSRSRTPLHVAAYMKQPAAARALLKLGANPNAIEIDKYDIVTIAAVGNDIEMLKIALDGGASARNVTSRYDGTALIAAAHLGHVEAVKILIAAKAPLNHVNNLGWTALMEAIVLGNGDAKHTATVRALVEAGCDVNIADRQGVTPLQHARRRGYVEMARILENAGGR